MKLWIRLVLFPGLFLALTAGSWISTTLQVASGERYFRKAYHPGKDFYIVLSDYEWAELFGGSAGLGRLKTLSRDPLLEPGAGWVANRARDYIQSGGYLREITALQRMYPFRENPVFWFHLRCLYLRELLLSGLFASE